MNEIPLDLSAGSTCGVEIEDIMRASRVEQSLAEWMQIYFCSKVSYK